MSARAMTTMKTSRLWVELARLVYVHSTLSFSFVYKLFHRVFKQYKGMHSEDEGEKMASNSETKHKIVVAAIDFGTAFCGYAFSADPDNIYVPTGWGKVASIPHSYKTPNCVLTDSNLKFVALGYEALTLYTAMDDTEARKHRFFEEFKMTLHQQVCKQLIESIDIEARVSWINHGNNWLHEDAWA